MVGAILFSIILPIVYHLAFEQFPLEGLRGIALLAGIGAVVGAILGTLFPRVFGLVLELFLTS
jgi:hypothetical protein